MIIAEILVNMPVYDGLDLKRGSEYIMSAAVMRQLLRIYPGGITQTKNFNDFYKKLEIDKLKSGDKLFMFRSGGIGDVMFMLPLARYFKENFDVEIAMGTSPMYIDVIKDNKYVDNVIQMPFSLEEMLDTDYHLMFEGLIEDAPEKSQRLHSVDLFLDHAGIDYTKVEPDKKIPYIKLNPKRLEIFNKKYSKFKIDHDVHAIGIQVEASSPIRTFPLHKLTVIIRKLLDRGCMVFVFGGKRQEKIGRYLADLFLEKSNFVNLIIENLSLEESIFYTTKMDVFIAPDSAFTHIAGSLNVPIVGLYGCFPSMLRMKYYKNAIGIDTNVPCAPGFKHGHNPCAKGIPSPCFSVIKEDDVINAIDHLLHKKKIQLIYPRYNEFVKGELKESPFSFVKK